MASTFRMAPTFELHVSPAQWGLPSMDATSLSLIIYLQLVMPSQFVLVETIDPELSPSGQLPFLKNGDDIVAPFSSIIYYLADKGFSASPLQSSNALTAWLAHAESNLGDLVLHMFYSAHENWKDLTSPSLGLHYSALQRYLRLNKIRQSYKSRLEAAGLWSLPEIEIEQEKKQKWGEGPGRRWEEPSVSKKKEVKTRDKFLQVFEREKILDRSRSTLDLYLRLLGQKDFFHGDRPTLLDAVVASHVLLLIRPPFPDPLLQDLVYNSYPSLAAHANRVHNLAVSVPFSRRRLCSSETDVWVTRLRFAFVGVTLGGIVTYLSYSAS